jgi:hypothetical protein
MPIEVEDIDTCREKMFEKRTQGIRPWYNPATPPRLQTVLHACHIVCERLAAICVFRTSKGWPKVVTYTGYITGF